MDLVGQSINVTLPFFGIELEFDGNRRLQATTTTPGINDIVDQNYKLTATHPSGA